MRTLKAQDGMSLVEATIILLVLMLLTSVLAPSMYDFVLDAKMVKVKEDCEAIGISTMRLVGDIGTCLKNDASDSTCLQVLYSRGVAATDQTGGTWYVEGGIGDMERQFTTNASGASRIYPLPMWRGAYLPGPIGPDPWGARYAVNTKFLGEKLLDDPTPRAQADADVDVFCISAGPNRKYETRFNGNGQGGTTRGGDDFVFVIAGSQYARQF